MNASAHIAATKMNNSMHPDRIAAKNAMKIAKALMDASVTEEQAEERYEAFMVALRHSVAMDAKYPTASETKRANNRAYLNSIGLYE